MKARPRVGGSVEPGPRYPPSPPRSPRPAPSPPAAYGAASGFQVVPDDPWEAPLPASPPPPPMEDDAFWGQKVARIPQVPEQVFWGRGRPQGKPPFLLWSGALPVRFAAVLLGLGFFSVFFWQLGFLQFGTQQIITSIWYPVLLYMLILGAPVFEEFLKAGLALFVVSFVVPRSPAGRVAVGVLRWGAGLAAGAGFGIMEHYLTYSSESTFMFAERVAFHAGAAALTLVAYTVLEPLPDVRVRWLSLLPSVFLHWLNNFSAIPVALLSALAGVDDVAPFAWAATITGLLWILMLVLPVSARRVRRSAERVMARRFPRLPPYWKAWVARRAAGEEPPLPRT